jgi:hypothetical protein
MFRASACPSSGVQLVTNAFGGQPWKAAWVAVQWTARRGYCSKDVARLEQCTHLAAQRYTTQAAFQGWAPNAVVTVSTPDDGHADA